MIPANNTTMEREILAWLPAGTTCRTIRIPRGKGLLTPETLPAYRASAIELARQFATPDIDVVAYGCTAAGFISGPAGDRALAAELAAVTGKPVVTTARSMVLALLAQSAKSIALVTPYSDAVNRQLTVFMTEADIAVKHMRTFGATDVEALGRIQSHEVDALARQTMAPDCDALFIACSQLPTADILGGLERDFAKPAWSSIRATAWQAALAAEKASAPLAGA